jgi:hypothetical protein
MQSNPDKVRVERTRTIQVLGAYSAETCTLADEQSVTEEVDRQAARAAMIADLDRQLNQWEKDLRASLKAAAQAAKDAADAPPGFTTADRLPPTPAPQGDPLPTVPTRSPKITWPKQTHEPVAPREAGPRTTPPPSALRSVSDGTADELRALGLRLADLGQPYEGPLPSSEAEAQALLPQLRARVFDLTKAKAPPAQPLKVTREPGFRRPDGTEFKPGHQAAAWERKCGHDAHGTRNPQAISATEWNDSQRALGRPMCASHLKETLKGGKA